MNPKEIVALCIGSAATLSAGRSGRISGRCRCSGQKLRRVRCVIYRMLRLGEARHETPWDSLHNKRPCLSDFDFFGADGPVRRCVRVRIFRFEEAQPCHERLASCGKRRISHWGLSRALCAAAWHQRHMAIPRECSAGSTTVAPTGRTAQGVSPIVRVLNYPPPAGLPRKKSRARKGRLPTPGRGDTTASVDLCRRGPL